MDQMLHFNFSCLAYTGCTGFPGLRCEISQFKFLIDISMRAVLSLHEIETMVEVN